MHFFTILEKRIDCIIEGAFNAKCTSYSKKREKMWAAFYQFRAKELCTMWNELITTLGLSEKFRDVWLPQTVTRLVLESQVKIKCCFPSSDAATIQAELDTDELNALRYAAGYVMLSIWKKVHCKVISDWISRQVDVDSTTSAPSFLDYTKQWIRKVDRGGLFHVSDVLYEVFVALEEITRYHLNDMADSKGIDKEKVIECILDDSRLQQLWLMVADELNEEVKNKLLRDVVQLWVTIRGFRYASAIVEEYKRSCGSLKRKRAHRKELKRKSDAKKKCQDGV